MEDNINMQTIVLENDQNRIPNVGISNKEALKEKIHEIHNYLRNNGAGYGMNALKVFNVFYGLKKIEEHGLIDKVNLKRPECEFSYLLKLANKDKGEKLVELIFGIILDSICQSNINKLLFYEIPKNIKGSVFVFLIKEINKITLIEKSCNVLLSGKIYEYFIGRDESAISELGAYFTDRHIVNYILEKLDPSPNEDGSIPTMIDMFGGSGGFTTGYINYLNDNFSINWSKELNKISHFDMNEDVIKSAGLEFFCLTGILPDMDNLKYRNSFIDEFNDQKYQYILTNPPYGGDKISKSDAQKKREKIKKYINKEKATGETQLKRQKQLKEIQLQEKQEKLDNKKKKVSISVCSKRIQKFSKEYNLKGNDKESCSLILLMNMLDTNGTAIGVLKEGLFFNKIYANLRKCLIENFNVKEIISIPNDQFENTKTKTSIIIFDNSLNKTNEVKFSDLIIERYKEDKFIEINNNIEIIENEGDISNISDKVISIATKNEILSNKIYSLNGKEYNKKIINIGKEYQLIKLGDICEYINKKYKLSKETYNYVEIGDITNNMICSHKEYKVNELPNKACNMVEYGNILISCVRPKSSKIILIDNNFKDLDKFVFSSGLANIKLKNTNLSYYIYAILFILADNFEKDLCNGSTYPRFSPKLLENIQIPVHKSEEKIYEWIRKLSESYNVKDEELHKYYISKLGQEIIFEEINIKTSVDNNDYNTFKYNYMFFPYDIIEHLRKDKKISENIHIEIYIEFDLQTRIFQYAGLFTSFPKNHKYKYDLFDNKNGNKCRTYIMKINKI